MAACAQALLGDDEPEGSQLLGMPGRVPAGACCMWLVSSFSRIYRAIFGWILKLLQWIWADNPRIRRL